jgi:hypothetical protein
LFFEKAMGGSGSPEQIFISQRTEFRSSGGSNTAGEPEKLKS